MADGKAALGRPTAYRPEYCDRVIKLMADGHSMEGVAGKLGVGLRTLYDWKDAHEEFRDALEIGRTGASAWWEEQLLNAAKTGTGNAAILIFGVKNRSKGEWRDVHRQELTGADGEPIKTTQRIERVIVDPSN